MRKKPAAEKKKSLLKKLTDKKLSSQIAAKASKQGGKLPSSSYAPSEPHHTNKPFIIAIIAIVAVIALVILLLNADRIVGKGAYSISQPSAPTRLVLEVSEPSDEVVTESAAATDVVAESAYELYDPNALRVELEAEEIGEETFRIDVYLIPIAQPYIGQTNIILNKGSSKQEWIKASATQLLATSDLSKDVQYDIVNYLARMNRPSTKFIEVTPGQPVYFGSLILHRLSGWGPREIKVSQGANPFGTTFSKYATWGGW